MNSSSSEAGLKTENAARTRLFLDALKERRATLRRTLPLLFASSQEFVGEFGCGHGHFLVAYAQAHPTTICVGIDIDASRVHRAARKQARAKASQLHFLHADAGLFLETLPDPVRFTHVFILFPDPWPKKRHHKNRLIQPAFLDAVRRFSTERTRIYFRTDHEPYFEHARAVLTRHTGWQLVDEPWPFEYETVFQSRAESFRSLVARVNVATA